MSKVAKHKINGVRSLWGTFEKESPRTQNRLCKSARAIVKSVKEKTALIKARRKSGGQAENYLPPRAGQNTMKLD